METMTRWLLSPAVALIGLLGTLVTVGQGAWKGVRWGRRVSPAMRDAGVRPAAMWVAFGVLASGVVVSVASWPAVVTIASRYGGGGVNSWFYPLAPSCLGIAGALGLVIHAYEDNRLSGWRLAGNWGMVAAALAFEIGCMAAT